MVETYIFLWISLLCHAANWFLYSPKNCCHQYNSLKICGQSHKKCGRSSPSIRLAGPNVKTEWLVVPKWKSEAVIYLDYFYFMHRLNTNYLGWSKPYSCMVPNFLRSLQNSFLSHWFKIGYVFFYLFDDWSCKYNLLCISRNYFLLPSHLAISHNALNGLIYS